MTPLPPGTVVARLRMPLPLNEGLTALSEAIGWLYGPDTYLMTETVEGVVWGVIHTPSTPSEARTPGQDWTGEDQQGVLVWLADYFATGGQATDQNEIAVGTGYTEQETKEMLLALAQDGLIMLDLADMAVRAITTAGVLEARKIKGSNGG